MWRAKDDGSHALGCVDRCFIPGCGPAAVPPSCRQAGPAARRLLWRCRTSRSVAIRTACHAAVSGRLATEWLSAYVSLHGEWPNSWDAIRTCLRELPSSDRDQEALIDMAQTYIAIDFQADARKIAGQTVEEFDSIRTLDNYGIDHRDYWQVEMLIELLQIWNDINSQEPCLGAAKRPAESNPTLQARSASWIARASFR